MGKDAIKIWMKFNEHRGWTEKSKDGWTYKLQKSPSSIGADLSMW